MQNGLYMLAQYIDTRMYRVEGFSHGMKKLVK